LGESGSRQALNGKIDEGAIELDKINDMPSLTAFKDRLHDVLTTLMPSVKHEK
jgi:hypothetical protein